jgi:excisionase family DNA binding protein
MEGGEKMANQLLKVAEAAEYLNLSEYQTLSYAREGIIPSVRCGRLVRFSPAALNEFIESGGKSYEGGWRRKKV